MVMGAYLRFWRVGKVMEASAFGVICLLLAVWGGKVVHQNPELARIFGLKDINLAWGIIAYGFAASVLPVWLLLAPRDYLSTFMKLGTIFALALGIFLVLPNLQMPAVSRFVDGSGLVVAGKLFPFCFITIACGAISGFHTLIASGTTPKLVTRESYARPIGYGAMCLESLVAIMALIAACTLPPGVYLSMNMKGEPPATVAKATAAGFPVTEDEMGQMAHQIGEKTLFGRTGGAATLAVGMAQIFSQAVKGRWLDLWYHFAIMFEALFILTTIDAGTRVGRYLLQDLLGQVWRPLGQTQSTAANALASVLVVGAWGYFLIQGVRDPLGGINSLWPLFGIANQMLAGIALCLATTILLKMAIARSNALSADAATPGIRAKSLAFITLIPLAWLLAVTLTAGSEKIWHPDPRIGFLSQANLLNQKQTNLEHELTLAKTAGAPNMIETAEKALRENRVLHLNNILDAIVAGLFLSLIGIIVLLSTREWLLLLRRRKPAALCETKPVWLPGYAVAEARPSNLAGMAVLGFALVKEISGEAQLERTREVANKTLVQAPADAVRNHQINQRHYLEALDHRFKGVRRCC
jgi:carbon starvation protein